MTPVLIIEIVSALVALACLVALVVQLIQLAISRMAGRPQGEGVVARHHSAVALTLCGASVVHGVAAMVYASGTSVLAYVFGWLAVVCFLASGACVMPLVRRCLRTRALPVHIGFFMTGAVFVVVHAVAARL